MNDVNPDYSSCDLSIAPLLSSDGYEFFSDDFMKNPGEKSHGLRLIKLNRFFLWFSARSLDKWIGLHETFGKPPVVPLQAFNTKSYNNRVRAAEGPQGMF
jgi:hypothetical protein